MPGDGAASAPHIPAAGREKAATAMAEAAAAWLGTLSEDQLLLAAFDSPLHPDAEAERLRWFYTPTGHGGLAIRDQSPRQQSLAMQLVATGLSTAGYATVSTVMGLENVLDQLEGWTVHWGRQRGRDPGLYWLRIFGRPGDRIWAWRLGGHHISLNSLVVAGRLVSTTPASSAPTPPPPSCSEAPCAHSRVPRTPRADWPAASTRTSSGELCSTPAPCPTSSPATGHTSATATR